MSIRVLPARVRAAHIIHIPGIPIHMLRVCTQLLSRGLQEGVGAPTGALLSRAVTRSTLVYTLADCSALVAKGLLNRHQLIGGHCAVREDSSAKTRPVH